MTNEWIGRCITYNNFEKDKEFSFTLFERSKSPQERIYRGMIDLSLIESEYSTYHLIKSIYKNKDYFSIDDDLINNLDFKTCAHEYKDIYFLGKICYLVEEFLSNKKFLHPLCVYYNPRIQKCNAHPGIGRMAVFKILNIDRSECFYFNTGGVSLEDAGIVNINSFIPVDLREIDAESNKTMCLRFTLDHGTIIPQITYDFDTAEQIKRLEFAKKIFKKIKHLNFNSNIHIPFLKNYINNNSNILINFTNFFTKLDISRAIIFGLLNKSHIFPNIEIICHDQ